MEKPRYRISSIDLLRGAVMIIMALDHVRDYFHDDAMLHDPMDLETTSPALFITRWITHYCAPIFVFLSGISAYLSGLKKTKHELGNFLMTRGLWLVLVEVTVVTFGWTFNPFFNTLVLQVIWAIGISMVFLGLLCRLPYKWILVIAITIVCGHNLLDVPEETYTGRFGLFLDLIHHGHFKFYPFNATGSHGIIVVYPVLPWIGIMSLGYAFGKLFEPQYDARKRKSILLMSGVGMIVLFIILRLINQYGDKMHWQEQQDSLYTLFSFVHVSKYPPSLMFTCMTLGPAMLFLAFTENLRNGLARFTMVFGRVPFFYYILHIYFIHLFTVLCFYLSGYGNHQISSSQSFFNFRPPDFGFSLWIVYLIWIGLILCLYYPCRWYDRYKSTHKHWWLSYL
jgi:uncharacterized membrane protein